MHTIGLSVAEADDAISTAGSIIINFAYKMHCLLSTLVGLLDGLQNGVLPNTTLLMREFLQCLVYIAHRAFTNKQQNNRYGIAQNG